MKKSKKEEVILPEISQRFLSAINKLGISGYRLSKEIPEITESKLTHIRNGRNEPSKQILELFINKYTQIDRAWLIAGVGSMLKEKEKPVDNSELLKLYRELKEKDEEIKSLKSEVKHQKERIDTMKKRHDVVVDTMRARIQELEEKLADKKISRTASA